MMDSILHANLGPLCELYRALGMLYLGVRTCGRSSVPLFSRLPPPSTISFVASDSFYTFPNFDSKLIKKTKKLRLKQINLL